MTLGRGRTVLRLTARGYVSAYTPLIHLHSLSHSPALDVMKSVCLLFVVLIVFDSPEMSFAPPQNCRGVPLGYIPGFDIRIPTLGAASTSCCLGCGGWLIRWGGHDDRVSNDTMDRMVGARKRVGRWFWVSSLL